MNLHNLSLSIFRDVFSSLGTPRSDTRKLQPDCLMQLYLTLVAQRKVGAAAPFQRQDHTDVATATQHPPVTTPTVVGAHSKLSHVMLTTCCLTEHSSASKMLLLSRSKSGTLRGAEWPTNPRSFWEERWRKQRLDTILELGGIMSNICSTSAD